MAWRKIPLWTGRVQIDTTTSALPSAQSRTKESEYLAQRREGAKENRVRTLRLGDRREQVSFLGGLRAAKKIASLEKTLMGTDRKITEMKSF
jgi:hypothetical protein